MKYDVCQISNLYDIVNGYAFKSSRFKVSGGIPIVRIANITDSGINLENVIFYENMPEYEKFKIKNNDVLIALSGATTGKFGIYDKDEIAYLNQRVARFRAKDDNPTLSKYLYYFLYLKRQEILRSAYGGAQPNISTKQIEIMQIPFWGLESIEKLIKRIDSLFADIDAGLEKINEVKAKLELYKQSVLQAAFSGELIEGVTQDEWQEVTLSELISNKGLFRDGNWVESKDQDANGDVRLIQLADIGEMSFLDHSKKFMKKEHAEEMNVLFLEQGDLLIARMPSPLGRACIFPFREKKKYITVVDVAVFRNGNEDINTKYLMYCINSPQFREKVDSLQSGSTRQRISRINLGLIKFFIAPYSVQNKIVKTIDNFFDEININITNLMVLEQQLNSLKQSILKQAFEGNLV